MAQRISKLLLKVENAIDYINYCVCNHYFRISQVIFIEHSMLATINETILERHSKQYNLEWGKWQEISLM